jgi:hypothetical protein
MPPVKTIGVKFDSITFRVPIYIDEKTTLAIAQEVYDRYKAFEADSPFVDTMASAFETAVAYAVELHDKQEELKQETKEFLLALHALSDTIQSIIKAAEPQEEE